MEEKAPLLKRQKQEYEEALNTINNLTNQLEKSMIVNIFLLSKKNFDQKIVFFYKNFFFFFFKKKSLKKIINNFFFFRILKH